MTGEDLGHKPSVAEQAQFDYCLLGKVFNKGLEKEDSEERHLKRLKNIQDKTEKHSKLIEEKQRNELGMKLVINIFWLATTSKSKRYTYQAQ